MTENKDNVYSIREFIDENINLLTAFSIFIGLALYTSNLIEIELSKRISFIFMSLSFFVWYELRDSTSKLKPFSGGNITNLFFYIAFEAAYMFVFFIWAKYSKGGWIVFIFLACLLLMNNIWSKEQYQLFAQKKKHKKWKRWLIRFSSVFLTGIIFVLMSLLMTLAAYYFIVFLFEDLSIAKLLEEFQKAKNE